MNDRKNIFLEKQTKLVQIQDVLRSKKITPNEAAKYSVKISKDGVKRDGLELLGLKDVNLTKVRNIWADIPHYDQSIEEQVEIDAHYSGYLKRQSHDISF